MRWTSTRFRPTTSSARSSTIPSEAARRASALPLYEPAVRHVLPESVSLLDHLPPLRGQGRRGTCVAHAALAVREALEIAAGATPDFDLSEQYVYWWCKQRDGLQGRSGTYLSLGMRCLAVSGAPLESHLAVRTANLRTAKTRARLPSVRRQATPRSGPSRRRSSAGSISTASKRVCKRDGPSPSPCPSSIAGSSRRR